MLWWQEQTPNKNWITGAWIICKFALGTNVGTQEASEQDLNKKYNLQVFIAAKTWSDNCLGDKVHSRPHPLTHPASLHRKSPSSTPVSPTYTISNALFILIWKWIENIWNIFSLKKCEDLP